MTKKIKQFKDSFNEEKARVRLYKSGKNWIKAGIKEIQLLRVMGLPFNGQKITDKEDVNANNNSNNMKKNISKASTVIGGAFTFNMLNDHQAFAASETPVTSEISSNSTTVGDQTSTKESRDSAASTESKDSAARSSETYHYHRVVEMLEECQAISKIAKEVNITRQTVYRIKHDNNESF